MSFRKSISPTAALFRSTLKFSVIFVEQISWTVSLDNNKMFSYFIQLSNFFNLLSLSFTKLIFVCKTLFLLNKKSWTVSLNNKLFSYFIQLSNVVSFWKFLKVTYFGRTKKLDRFHSYLIIFVFIQLSNFFSGFSCLLQIFFSKEKIILLYLLSLFICLQKNVLMRYFTLNQNQTLYIQYFFYYSFKFTSWTT
jgi:hypothetical protein